MVLDSDDEEEIDSSISKSPLTSIELGNEQEVDGAVSPQEKTNDDITDLESGVENEFQSTSEDEDSRPAFSTKIKHVLKILHKEAPEHKFIIFSQFTSMLDLVEPFLKRDGLKYTRYDGSMRNDLREASLSRLRNDPGCRILLCSLKCGSLGLNLTAATRVIILEPFWNPVSYPLHITVISKR